MTVRRLAARLAALFQKNRIDGDLDGDIAAHLEMAERDARASGLSPEEARAAASRRFGGIEQMKEEHRDRRGLPWIETFVRDLRYGVASLARDPGFTAIVVVVLALGIGANVAMFSLVDAVLLKPIPFPDPERIVRVWEAPRPGSMNSTSTLDFLDWRRLGTGFEALSASRLVSAALTGSGDPARLEGRTVTADYFRIFSTRTQLGRTFAPEEDRPGAAPVVVLSHAAWQTHFGGAPDILSRRPILDGEAHQVIGVLPPGAFDREEVDFWKPLIFTPDQFRRDSHWLTVHGRLRAGVTLSQAREQMQSIDAALTEATPFFKRNWTIMVEPFARLLVGDALRRSIAIAFGAVGLVLLIACANVANLLLARGATRGKEMAVRAALGASRGRLIAQLLTESLVLCLAGGAAGVALGWLMLEAAQPFLLQSLPYTADVHLDLRAVAFAAAAALGAALLVGALPSFQTSFGNLALALNRAARGSSGSHARVRRVLVVAEVALSLVLVCGALLLLRSLFNLQQIETGIRIDNVMTVSVDLPVQAYPTPEKAALFYETAAAQLKGVPGVTQSALTSHLPLRWINNGEALEVPGVAGPVAVRFKRVDPGYFNTLGIALLAGRGIAESDRLGARRVVVINEALAARLADVAGIKNPVGQTVGVYCPYYVKRGTSTEQAEIAGVIRSERVDGPGRPDPPVVYVPLAQVPGTEVKLLVRTQSDAAAVMPSLRAAIRGIDPDLPLGDVATMQQIRDRTLNPVSRPAWLIGVFALVAALLAAIGLYGVLSLAVTQQRREIGIRMALGARSRDVLLQILRNALVLVASGLALGICGAFALTRVMKSLLYQVSPLDPLALAAACASMLLIGLIAGFVPASRAARVDPVTTLRDEA